MRFRIAGCVDCFVRAYFFSPAFLEIVNRAWDGDGDREFGGRFQHPEVAAGDQPEK